MSLHETEVPRKAFPPTEPPPPPRTKGCGCGTCALGCLGMLFLALLVCAVAAWYAWKKLPDWSRSALVATIEQTDLPAEQKQRIVAQVDRVMGEYNAGRLTFAQLNAVLEELGKSPLFSLVMAYGAAEKYIQPSGLSTEEKEAARIALQRVARGVYENRVPAERLDPALDYVSTKDASGNRRFADKVSDQELRAMIAECRRIADSASIPPGPFEIDAASEIEQAVDRALDRPNR